MTTGSWPATCTARWPTTPTAAQLFADFIRNHPGHANVPDARLLLARSYARSSRCAEAVPAYDSFVERHSGHLSAAEARRERADCLQQLDRFEEAAEAFEEVQRLYSESGYAADALLQAAGNHLRAGDAANAVRVYAELLSEYGRDARGADRAVSQLARVRFAGGDPESAQDLLSEVRKAAPASEEARDALLLSGQIHLFLGRTAAGATAFRRLHQAFPRSAESDSAHLVLGQSPHGPRPLRRSGDGLPAGGQGDPGSGSEGQGPGRIRRRPAAFRAARGGPGALRAAVADRRSRCGRPVARPGDARTPRYLSDRPGDSHPRYACSWTSCKAPSSGGAPPAYAAAAVRQLGALYRRQGDLPRARSWFLRYLDDAERLGVDFPESEAERDLTRLHLAQVYDASGYHDEAVRLFTALSRDSGPVAAEAQYGLADAYDGSGARRLAVAEYGTFLERFPRHPRAGQVRQRVEYLDGYTITDADGLAPGLAAEVDRRVDRRAPPPDPASTWPASCATIRTSRVPCGPGASMPLPTRTTRPLPKPGSTWPTAFTVSPASVSSRGEAPPATPCTRWPWRKDALLGESGAGEWSRMAQLRRAESIADSVPEDRRQRTLEAGLRRVPRAEPVVRGHPRDPRPGPDRPRRRAARGRRGRPRPAGSSGLGIRPSAERGRRHGMGTPRPLWPGRLALADGRGRRGRRRFERAPVLRSPAAVCSRGCWPPSGAPWPVRAGSRRRP